MRKRRRRSRRKRKRNRRGRLEVGVREGGKVEGRGGREG
jgi:hypothetical protein